MNTLPFISHHLFVAAIGNEGREGTRPARQERPFEGPAEAEDTIAMGLLAERKPEAVGQNHPVQASTAPARG
jgi:hypothetical protein